MVKKMGGQMGAQGRATGGERTMMEQEESTRCL